MKQKRYSTPKMKIEPWLGKECWMFANISDGTEPTLAPARQPDLDLF